MRKLGLNCNLKTYIYHIGKIPFSRRALLPTMASANLVALLALLCTITVVETVSIKKIFPLILMKYYIKKSYHL